MPTESTKQADQYNCDLYFFNLAAMESGYGTGQSRVITLQASFDAKKLKSFALLPSPGSGSTSSSQGSKVYAALQFAGLGIELSELTLKAPAAPAGGGGGSSAVSSLSGWLDWFPKVGIFGITLIGVVIWNVRKVAGKQSSSSDMSDLGSLDKFNMDDFSAKLRQKRDAKKKKEGDADMANLGSMDDDDDESIEEMMKAMSRERATSTKAAGSGGSSSSAGSGGLGSSSSSGMDSPGGLFDDKKLSDMAAKIQQMEEKLGGLGGLDSFGD